MGVRRGSALVADTHYDVLEVSRKASPEMVKKAYQFQLALHHPDRGGDAAKAQALTEAYAILSNPEKRREYDDGLAKDEAEVSEPSPAAPAAEEEPEPEPVVEWGEEVPVEEPVAQERPPAPQPMPQFPYQVPTAPPESFQWPHGGTWPTPAPHPPRQVPTRPVVNWIAGGTLVFVSLLPVLLAAVTSGGVVSNVLCSGVGLVIGWAAGHSRAAGAPLSPGYVIYVAVLITATLLGFALLGGDWPVVTMSLPVLWVASYVVFVESSCIWRRKVYWAQA